MTIHRRNFMKLLGCSSIAMSAPLVPTQASAAAPDRFWVFLSANGGWDTTSLLDPKGNINPTGKGNVNNYARDDIKEIGNIKYAPWAIADDPGTYDRFFTTYASELLVLNGIDMETNAHPVGQTKIWSGDGSNTFPCLAALIAACNGSDLPLSFISNGYYDGTAGLVPKTRANNVNTLYGLALPNKRSSTSNDNYFHPDIDVLLKSKENQRLLRLLEQESLPERKLQINQLYTMRQSAGDIEQIIEKLPDDISRDNLSRQAQICCAAFSAGIAASANLTLGGFDTHGDNDQRAYTQYERLLRGIEFLMQEAERQGIRDKLNVVVGSDFGRRPFYNNQNGKDHWPVGSMMMMGPDIRGNRTIGATTNGLEARKINTNTLQLDDNGEFLTYRDINQALRNLAGIANHPFAEGFPVIGNDLDLFS